MDREGGFRVEVIAKMFRSDVRAEARPGGSGAGRFAKDGVCAVLGTHFSCPLGENQRGKIVEGRLGYTAAEVLEERRA